MFSNLYNQNWGQIFQYRLEGIQSAISAMNFPTKEEYQTTVQSRLNELMKYRASIRPLHEITKEAPALVGGIQKNLDTLDEDVRAVSSELLATEQIAVGLLNLYGSTQSALRQRIRQMIYTPTASRFSENFIGGALIGDYTTDTDLNAGIVTLPVESSQTVVPDSVRVGVSSSGAMLSTSRLAALHDNQAQSLMQWAGDRLELVFEFSTNVVLNRIKIEPHDYEGLIVEELSCSPDGIYQDNVLEELSPEAGKIDAASNKFNGEYVIDFTPKETRYLKLVLRDCVGKSLISLRGITFYSRKYASNGYLTFKPVKLTPGKYQFTTQQTTTDKLTSIQHQVSSDGTRYRVIAPGEILDLGAVVWYRIYFFRMDATKDGDNSPFVAGIQDPEADPPSFTITEPSTTTDLGGGVYQREIPIDTLNGKIRLKDKVVDGTFEVLVSDVALANDEFTFSSNILSIRSIDETGTPVSNITFRYQTSLTGQLSFGMRRAYYSPVLSEISFEKL